MQRESRPKTIEEYIDAAPQQAVIRAFRKLFEERKVGSDCFSVDRRLL